jgi:hypothetical protein
MGTVAKDIRVTWTETREGPGCEADWFHINPAGWVCGDHLEPNKRGPRAMELPRLKDDEVVPGRYAKVVGEEALIYAIDDAADGGPQVSPGEPITGSVTVRHYGDTVVDEVIYWHVGKGRWVDADDLREHRPSRFQGVRLGDETGRALPLLFAISLENPAYEVPVVDKPGGAVVDRLSPRTLVSDLERRSSGAGAEFVRIGDGRWIREVDVRTVRGAPPPRGLMSGERWVDVDLSSQSLVAYEGEMPVFVTLISSGTPKNATETGIYRVWIKFSETSMSGQMGEEEPYDMATVPWTQFYAKDLALHTSYWHDHFGIKKSHGCVNLSPVDARFLYFWSDPQVPPGWTMANGYLERPGSLVRVRSKHDPNPEFRGYAKKVLESRLGTVTSD